MEVGNGALEHPVALITADEIVAVGGGKYNTNNTNYIYINPEVMYSGRSRLSVWIHTFMLVYSV